MTGTVDFGSNHPKTSNGPQSMFIATYDSSLNYVNVIVHGALNPGDPGYIRNTVATVDANGNIIATGFCAGGTTAQPYVELGGGNIDATFPNLFVVKYSPTGTLLFTPKLGRAANSTSISSGTAIAADSSGNIFCVGYLT